MQQKRRVRVKLKPMSRDMADRAAFVLRSLPGGGFYAQPVQKPAPTAPETSMAAQAARVLASLPR